MDQAVFKYADKLVRAGLTAPGVPLMGVLDSEFAWNRRDDASVILENILPRIQRKAILFAQPAEPYRTMIDYLAQTAAGPITPQDFETRIFLHDLPVIPELNEEALAMALAHRRALIIAGRGIVTVATTSPERAFVMYSSVCFACFVKFFADYLFHHRRGTLDDGRKEAFRQVMHDLDPLKDSPETLQKGRFFKEADIMSAMEQAGALTVSRRLVDSNFGNISYFSGDKLYISRKGSALDELNGRIVAVDVHHAGKSADIASTELPAHRQIVTTTGYHAVLHGHPKFSVILSMDCEIEDCRFRGACHTECPHHRTVLDVPVVSGEAGDGPYGLHRTVPPALEACQAVIVYGHGLFTAGKDDFNEAFGRLMTVENACRREYFRRAEMTL